MDMRIAQHIKEKWIDPLLSFTKANENTLQARADLMRRAQANQPLAVPLLAEGTNPATIKTTNSAAYLNKGLLKTKAATDNIAIPASSVVPISSFCKFLVCFNAAGTVSITKGNNGASAALALLPAVPTDDTPFGYFEIATDGATTYTPGTTDNGAAGITDVYVDLAWPDSGVDALATAVGALTHPTESVSGGAVKP